MLSPGQSVSAEATLRNRGDRPVAVERIEISCPCLRVEPGALNIDPGERRTLLLRFDPSEEPSFRGRLAIEVTGRGPMGESVFGTRVTLEVRGKQQGNDQ